MINITLNCYYSGKHSLSRSIFSVSRVCFSLVPTFTLKKQTINILDKLDNHIFFVSLRLLWLLFFVSFHKIWKIWCAYTQPAPLEKTFSGNVGSCKNVFVRVCAPVYEKRPNQQKWVKFGEKYTAVTLIMIIMILSLVNEKKNVNCTCTLVVKRCYVAFSVFY